MCILWRVRIRIAAILITVVAGASCRSAAPADAKPQITQPGAPGQPSQVIDAAQATDLSQVQYTAADVQFMQGMIGHHAQAVEMVALLPTGHSATTCASSACASTCRRRTRST